MKLVVALTFAFFLNLFLWWGQVAIDVAAIDAGVSTQTRFVYEGSIISQYDAGNYTINENVTGILPEGQAATLDVDTGGFFVDTFSSVKAWFENSIVGQGVSFLWAFITAVPHALISMNLPIEITFGFSVFWYALVLFLIVMMFRGYGQ